MISETPARLTVQKPTSRTCGAAVSPEFCDGPERDFWPARLSAVQLPDNTSAEAGYRFKADLETNLQVDNRVVAPAGTTVYGRLANAKKAGNMSGGAELTLELTDIVINGTAYPLLTSTYEVRSQGQGSKTAKRVVGGAGLGTLIGGIAGGGKGAAIGAGAGAATGTVVSGATKGKQIQVPSESLLEFRLEQPTTLPIAK